MTPQSIYIHIPFCKTKCPYCDFASWANKEHLIDRYFNALLLEIKTKCEAYKHRNVIKTIFIGGGTPSLIHPDYYENFFCELKKYFKFDKDCEITLELNPGTARIDYLQGYKKPGINRISIGAQSFNEKILETLGRKHSVDETIEAIKLIKEAGFTNFNLDLIYAVPGITKNIWQETIYKALEFEPKHISAYSLTIEAGTPFEHIYKNKKLLPSDDFAFELYFELCNILKKNGFVHYEVSNFAKKDYECKHNLTYWTGKEYYAFGVGAHRYLNGLRTHNIRELNNYIECPNVEKIVDFPVDSNFEKIILNSRLNQGFDLSLVQMLSKKPEKEIQKLLNNLSQEGYIELLRDKIHLTDKGMYVNNEILLKLI